MTKAEYLKAIHGLWSSREVNAYRLEEMAFLTDYGSLEAVVSTHTPHGTMAIVYVVGRGQDEESARGPALDSLLRAVRGSLIARGALRDRADHDVGSAHGSPAHSAPKQSE